MLKRKFRLMFLLIETGWRRTMPSCLQTLAIPLAASFALGQPSV
jgi:hypothetical protein